MKWNKPGNRDIVSSMGCVIVQLTFKKVKNHMIKFLQRDTERKFTRSERIWLHEKTQVICTVSIKYARLVAFGCHNPVVNPILNVMDRLA